MCLFNALIGECTISTKLIFFRDGTDSMCHVGSYHGKSKATLFPIRLVPGVRHQ